MTLQTYTDSLSSRKQFDIAIKLAKLCLPIWDSYADKNELVYRDSVVGMTHKVDKSILAITIAAVERYSNMNVFQRFLDGKRSLMKARTKFDDPIVALQDDDWQLPDHIEKAFYAVYNLIECALGETKTVFGESTIYVCINQAADALDTSEVLSAQQIKDVILSSHGS